MAILLCILIFILTYAAIASEKFPRHWVALTGASLLVLTGILSIEEALAYINWETICLLAGMFILVAILQEGGFFTWLAMTSVRKVNYHPGSLFVILLMLSAGLAMFMDSITVMLFMAVLTLQLCRLLHLDPVPLVIAEVCAANTGGSATLMGDPPNVILGTTLGFSLGDFLTHTAPISAICALILLGFFYLSNHVQLRHAHSLLTDEKISEIEALHNEPVHAHLTRIGLAGFFSAVALLVLHTPLSELTGLHINTAAAALVPASLAMAALHKSHRRKTLAKVDGESILFFTGLFILIGGLEKVHLFKILADMLSQFGGSSSMNLVLALHWGPGLASGILDNVPLALAMSYVLRDLANMPGMPALGLMVWSLALGVDIGGNLTPIGASANVVAYSYVEHHHGTIGWKRWLLVAVPPTLMVMSFATLAISWKALIGWH